MTQLKFSVLPKSKPICWIHGSPFVLQLQMKLRGFERTMTLFSLKNLVTRESQVYQAEVHTGTH